MTEEPAGKAVIKGDGVTSTAESKSTGASLGTWDHEAGEGSTSDGATFDVYALWRAAVEGLA
jgi:hypothetical protein